MRRPDSSRKSPLFSDPKNLEDWLLNYPREVSVTMAARTALRALPFVQSEANWGDAAAERMLQLFRATQVAWVAASYPGSRLEIAGGAAAASHAILLGANPASDAVVFAVDASVSSIRSNYANFAARSMTLAVAHDAILGDPVMTEIMAIERISNDTERADAAIQLVNTAPWPRGIPDSVGEIWEDLRGWLLAKGDDWDVWVEWYEDRLAAEPALGQRFDVALANLPDELWKQGPAALNARIKELIAEHSFPREEGLPNQTVGAAAVFVRDSAGVIGLAPLGPEDRLTDTAEVRDFYAELRKNAAELQADGVNLLGARLSQKLIELQVRLPAEIENAIERLVWSSGNGLRGILARHLAVRAQRDGHPYKLDDGVAEGLRELVETFNQLAFADPKLRERDAHRPGPEERKREGEEIKIAEPLAKQAAGDRAITNKEAGEEIARQLDAIAERGDDLTDALNVKLASTTERHFFAGLMAAVYRAARNLPKAARLEGGKVPNEIFRGLYWAAGPTAVASAYFVRWEIINFVLSNADLFKAYGAIAFENSPGFRQMIEWLEANVSPEDNSKE